MGGDEALLQALGLGRTLRVFAFDGEVFDAVAAFFAGQVALQVVEDDVLLLLDGVGVAEVDLGSVQTQAVAVAAVGAAAACNAETGAVFLPLLAAEQPFAVALVGMADVAVPAEADTFATEVGGFVFLYADGLVQLAESGEAGLDMQVVVRDVSGEAAVGRAVGQGGAAPLLLAASRAAVEQRRVIDAGVQGGAVPGRLAAERAEAEADVGAAAEVVALVVFQAEFDAFVAQAFNISAVKEGAGVFFDDWREEGRSSKGDNQPENGYNGKDFAQSVLRGVLHGYQAGCEV